MRSDDLPANSSLARASTEAINAAMSIKKRAKSAVFVVDLRAVSAACLAFSSAALIWATSRHRASLHPVAIGRCGYNHFTR